MGVSVAAVALVGCTLSFALPGLQGLQAAKVDEPATAPVTTSLDLSNGTLSATDQRLMDLRKNVFCLTQSQHGRCTICSAAMMLRRKAYLDGKENWQSINEDALYADAWVWGTGIKHRFTSQGYRVKSFSWDLNPDAKERTKRLIRLLDKHPEGLVIYDGRIPHAIVLTRYDQKSKTFYCADPAGGSYSGKEIPLADSWNGYVRGGQDEVITSLTRSWHVAGPEKKKATGAARD